MPQILEHLKIMKYSKELEEILMQKKEIPHGSEMEIEIRAATIVSVELLK